MTCHLSKAVLCACLAAACLPAEAAPDENSAKPGWDGTAGLGPIVVPRYTGGKGTRTVPAPIVFATYNEIVRIDLFRGAVYLLSSDDKKLGFGLAVEPRFGFQASDGARLSGMSRRRHSLEGGPSFAWELPFADLSVSYFADLTGASRGNSFKGFVQRDFLDTDRWTFGALLGFDRMSARTANYYFGVPAPEVTANRAFYRAEGGTSAEAQATGAYKLDKSHSVVFGANATRLNPHAAASPIVETRVVKIIWLGYSWNL
ncbi:MAG: MipA/OmpV family protein [Betaproteobacteria bacterium]|nr:MipA/OmpV family protein [Betaproteobacteria bacterium]